MADKESWWSLATLFNFRGRSQPRPMAKPARPSNPYHAVSILPGPNACDAARRFAGKRYLSSEAPPLPLPSCDAFHCTCRFKHHNDRRVGPRRTADLGLITVMWNGPEKRKQAGGRRATDR